MKDTPFMKEKCRYGMQNFKGSLIWELKLAILRSLTPGVHKLSSEAWTTEILNNIQALNRLSKWKVRYQGGEQN